jgi:TonB-linked SusC/RagA family outer membrane protein
MFFVHGTYAQGRKSTETTLVSFSGASIPLSKLVEKIENETQFHILGIIAYDSIMVSADLAGKPLSFVLDEINRKCGLKWEVYGWDIHLTQTVPPNNASASGQQLIIPAPRLYQFRGTVFDNAGKPLFEATVTRRGTNKKKITNERGSFSLDAEDSVITIAVSFIGCESVEQIIHYRQKYNIVLKQVSTSIKEVICDGYSKESREGSMATTFTLTSSEIEKHPANNLADVLRGRVPGLNIVPLNGVTGSSFKFELRGRNSILNAGSPLFLINGVPIVSDNLNQLSSVITNNTTAGAGPFIVINVNEIESIQVSKDAIATSIYGSRGGNGVIAIWLKSAVPGVSRMVANVNTGISSVAHKFNLLSPGQYMDLRREAFKNDGITPVNSRGVAGYAPDLFDTTEKYIDWQKLLYGRVTSVTDANLSVSHGGDLVSSYIGFGYWREGSVMDNDMNFQRISLNSSLKCFLPDKRFSIESQFYFSSNTNKIFNGSLMGVLLPQNAARFVGRNKDLKWAEWLDWSRNPDADRKKTYKMNINSVIFNLSPQFLSRNKKLLVKTNIGANANFVNESSLIPSGAMMPLPADSLPGRSFLANSVSNSIIVEPVVEYTWKWLKLLAGGTYQYSKTSGDSSSGYYYDHRYAPAVGMAALITDRSPVIREYKYGSVFGKIDYNYSNTYFFNFTIRRDGSSRFAPQTRFGNFWATAIAWNFAKESFLGIPEKTLEYAKLRFSYGITGSDQIGDYRYLQFWQPSKASLPDTKGLSLGSLYNSKYSWEQSEKMEFSLDFLMFDGKFSGNVAYFLNRNTRQLVEYKLPRQTGYKSILMNFDAEIQNRGIELFLEARQLKLGAFQLSAGFNLTAAKNTLGSFDGLSQSDYSSRFIIGKSLNAKKLYRWNGVDKATGFDKFDDINGDGKLDENDLMYFDHTDPKYQGGLTLSVSYKGWSFSTSSEFKKISVPSYTYNVLMGGANWGSLSNQLAVVDKRWRQPGDEAEFSKASALSNSPVNLYKANLINSSRAITNGSFWALRDVSIGYTFRNPDLSIRHIDKIELSLKAQNLLTISPYDAGDAEIANLYALPTLRTIVAGVKIYFGNPLKKKMI